MILMVGLGNPGKKYEKTRHNIGFRVIEALADKLGLEFTESKSVPALYAWAGQTELIKPLTYVNESGQAVVGASRKHHLEPDDIWVIHDDVEVPFGEVRVKQGGTSGGHNGIKSIDEAVGSDYWRIRVGVGRDANFRELSDYVLASFTKEEEAELPSIIDRTVSHLIQSVDEQKLTPITFNAQKEHQND